MPIITLPNGATVEVDDAYVDRLLGLTPTPAPEPAQVEETTPEPEPEPEPDPVAPAAVYLTPEPGSRTLHRYTEGDLALFRDGSKTDAIVARLTGRTEAGVRSWRFRHLDEVVGTRWQGRSGLNAPRPGRQNHHLKKWTPEEDALLRGFVGQATEFTHDDARAVIEAFPQRTISAVANRGRRIAKGNANA
ncbi:hypothetical protein SEA_MILANI_40 [Microbacterium phage Milani]|nr:hypothetical protein SEA_MILANI_40 [Microbacterium phage Milani]